MTEWITVQAIAIAEAEHTLSGRADAPELRKMVADWIKQINSGDGKPEGTVGSHPATFGLAAEFERRGLDALAEAVRLIDQQEGKIPQGRWLLARLLGGALADNFSDELAIDKRYRLQFLSLQSYGAWRAFVTRLIENLHSNESVRAGFWREIGRIVEKVQSNPGHYAMSADSVAIDQAVKSYQDEPDIKKAWDTPLDAYVYFGEAFLIRIAHKLSATLYVDTLTRLSHPVFVDQCIELRQSDNLPELVRLAPPAFNDSGAFMSEGMVLLGILKACAKDCCRIAWGDSASPSPVAFDKMTTLEPTVSALRKFIAEIADALFERADAELTSWAWLERLIFEGEHMGVWRCRPQPGEGFVIDPLMFLIREIAAKLSPRTDYLEWINAAAPLWRVDRMAAVLAVAAQDESVEGEQHSAFLMNLLKITVPAYAGASSAFGRQDCVIGRLGAGYVLASKDPALFIRTLWDTLRPIREQAWRSRGSENRSDTGELAILWAICAMEVATGNLKISLWHALREILESAVRTDHPSSYGDTWPSALRRFFQSTNTILTGDADEDAAILAELLRPYVQADQDFFELIFTLESAGIERDAIKEATKRWGVLLEELARQYLVASTLRIQQGMLTRPWLDRVRDLIPEAV